jgi:hypothetical protein
VVGVRSESYSRFALGVIKAEIVLRSGVALIRGFAIPFRRLGIILRDASAIVVHEPESGLRLRVTLIGR